MSTKDAASPTPPDRLVAGLQARWHPLPGGAYPDFGCYVPVSSDAVLAQAGPEAYGDEERLPYYGTLWPAGASLAVALLETPLPAGVHALDLGCGIGACGLAALATGARVHFVDWEARALDFVRTSADALGLRPAACHVGTWDAAVPGAPFEFVLGADLVYEARNVSALTDALPRLVAPGGTLCLADPGRDGFPQLLEALAEQGFEDQGVVPLRAVGHGAEVRRAQLRRVPSSS